MNALKAIVVIMGVLILIGSTVVVITIVNRLSGDGVDEDTAPPPAAAFGVQRLPVPAGARLQSMIAEDDRLYLHVRGADGVEIVVVADPATGALLGRFRLEPAP